MALKDHLSRCHEQFKAAKAAKSAAKEDDGTATIQLDWSENYTLKQARDEKGYVWTKNESFSFGSLSDDTSHMSESAWAAIKELVENLIRQKNITTINIISDSPVSQFRNKTTISIMKKYAEEEKINLKWIFLESGHGKGVADAVGAALKRKFDETIAFDPDNIYRNALDLMKAVESSSDIKLFVYGTDDIKTVKESIPNIATVKGTASFHEVFAADDETLYAKNISNEKEKKLKTVTKK
ncbi:unnamed protein product [Didymodactylos carnosus]|uniref:Uncharacterized protein n=1 Tax=Didymodactylos carnosus TaxID=1234261 RepID=A0A815KRR6_9BILA|nr:unnamed protein product [Didymodactylos carnosus]CAF4294067.1 unnamed protein product [Didymodactylos carnosus]